MTAVQRVMKHARVRASDDTDDGHQAIVDPKREGFDEIEPLLATGKSEQEAVDTLRTVIARRITESNRPTHDFGDGAGEVPARRHANGRGWIARSAKVARSAFVGPLAQVYGNARVTGNADISGYARVFDNAQVKDDAYLHGHATVHEDAQVFGKAEIDEDGRAGGRTRIGGYTRIDGQTRVGDDTVRSDGPDLDVQSRLSGQTLASGFTVLERERA